MQIHFRLVLPDKFCSVAQNGAVITWGVAGNTARTIIHRGDVVVFVRLQDGNSASLNFTF